MSKKALVVIPEERIIRQIYVIRGQKVMLDADLAELYVVETRVLNQAVQRNHQRFPEDFMFQLNAAEWESLRSQTVILKKGRGQHPKYLPFAFTEQGVAMLSSVLKSKRAIAVNIHIMRIFVHMRQMIAGYKELSDKIDKLETGQLSNNKHIANIYRLIKELMEPAVPKRNPIGFKVGKK